MDSVLAYLLFFVFGTAISTFCLWAGMKITKEDGAFVGLLITAAISTLVGMIPIPYFGNILSFVVMCVLLYKFTSADRIWPDVILMVVVARLISIFVGTYIALLLISLFN